MKLRQFTPRQPIPDAQTSPRGWQPDTEVVIKHDDFYARIWECEYDKRNFDSDRDNMLIPNSTEITVRSEKATDDTKSTVGTTQESSLENIPHVDNSYDGTDTDDYMQPDAVTSVEQLTLRLPTPAAQNLIYVITRGQIAMTTTDTKSQVYFSVHPEQLRIKNVDFGKVLRNASGVPTRSPTALLISFLQRHQTASIIVLVILKLQKFKPHVPEKPT